LPRRLGNAAPLSIALSAFAAVIGVIVLAVMVIVIVVGRSGQRR
jgi:hypothetical protein